MLHLKRFTFDQHGPRKVSRPIRFGEKLKINRAHLAAGCNGVRKASPSYQLVAGTPFRFVVPSNLEFDQSGVSD